MPRQAEETLQYEDFVNWTVTSLKDFLALRGLKQSGKKAELVARAFGAYELKAPKKFSQEEINKKLKEEYKQRLAKHHIDIDPKTLESEVWKDDVKEWPQIDDGMLFSYILRVKAVDVEYIGKYKDQKAYSYWLSGFVDTVYHAVHNNFVFLGGNVSPSQRLNEDPHKVWICTEGPNDKPKILTSWCTCIAGTGEACNHVIALLYKLNYALKKDYISPACTSIPQGWNRGTKKEVTPSRIRDLNFLKHKKTRKDTNRDPEMEQELRKHFDPRKPNDRVLTDERVSDLLNTIKECEPSCCVLNSIEHARDDGLPQPLKEKAAAFTSLNDMKTKSCEEVVPSFLEFCQMSSDQVRRIEVETRGQSSNKQWFKHREGRITASTFHQHHTKMESILQSRKKNKGSTYTPLVFKILNKSDDISHLPQIKWGNDHEKDAIKAFMSDVASQHANGINGFKQCGLFIKPDYPFLAASPDGLFICDCCSPAVLEVKCPFSVRDQDINVKDNYKRVDFLEDAEGRPRLKRSHKYYTQMQAQMWVTGADHGFFIVWTKGYKPMYERVDLDRAFCTIVINNITLFYKTYVMPCMLGYRDIYQCPKCDGIILEEPEINNPEAENSICCDTCSTWWHLPCTGLSEEAADSLEVWVCNSCLVDIAHVDSSSESDSDFNNVPTASSSNDKVDLADSPTSTLDIYKPSTSGLHVADPVNLCSVCLLQDIPVGKEHICIICKKAVHAWCSNHEEITSSADLVCKHCGP